MITCINRSVWPKASWRLALFHRQFLIEETNIIKFTTSALQQRRLEVILLSVQYGKPQLQLGLIKSTCILAILLKTEGDRLSQNARETVGCSLTSLKDLNFLCSWATRKYISTPENPLFPKKRNLYYGSLWVRMLWFGLKLCLVWFFFQVNKRSWTLPVLLTAEFLESIIVIA